MTAPVVAIFGYDMEFYEKLPVLSPKNNSRSWFVGDGKEELVTTTAFRNGTLRSSLFHPGGAGAVGLDCGPMSGFDNAKVDAAFFRRNQNQIQFHRCALGYGYIPSSFIRAGPRLEFSEVCRVD